TGLTAIPIFPPGLPRPAVTLNPDGSLTFTPVARASGPESFCYQVQDATRHIGPPVSVAVAVASTPAPVRFGVPSAVAPVDAPRPARGLGRRDGRCWTENHHLGRLPRRAARQGFRRHQRP